MKRSFALLGLCSVLALPQLSVAQDSDDENYGVEANTWELVLSGSGNNDDNFDEGLFSGSASIGYFLGERLELVGRQGLDFGKTEDTGSTTIASTRIGFDYHLQFDEDQRMVPFLGANFGGIYGDGIREQFIAAPEAGFKFFVTPRAFLLGLAEYQFLFENSNDVDDAFDDGRFVYTLGFGFNW
jgi:hypothetical protein